MIIKKFLKKYTIYWKLRDFIINIYKSLFTNKYVKVNNKGDGVIKKEVVKGENNLIEIGEGTFLNNIKVRINESNNKIIIGKDCFIGKRCSFWMEGNNITIKIGSKTTFTHTVHFCAQEDNMEIHVGEDCMFSNNIIIRTSDSHPIYNKEEERINKPKSVFIGNHVWIAPNSKIMKGARIGDNSIIGSNTMVIKEVPCNCLAVGMPSKVVKEDIKWTRESLF